MTMFNLVSPMSLSKFTKSLYLPTRNFPIMTNFPINEIMTREILFADVDDSVVDVAKFMYSKNISCVLIKKDSIPEGIITERDIARKCIMGSNNLFNQDAGDIMTKPIIGARDDTLVKQICSTMKQRRIKKIFLLNEQEDLSGIISQTDIIKNIDKILGTQPGILRIRDFMTKELKYTDVNNFLMDCVPIMAKANISSILIMDQGRMIGVITERDIVRNIVVGENNFMSLKNKDVMSSPLITIDENSTVKDAAHTMAKRNIKRIIVTSNNTVTGILSQTDIVNNIDLLMMHEIRG